MKSLITASILVCILGFSFSLVLAASTLPEAGKLGLPFEGAWDATKPIVSIIKTTIMFIGVFAVIAISWGGIQFLISMGSDEKVKHAKHTIIYALIGVVLSVVAYTIIDIVNSLQI